jgi:hypothetical protein
MVRVDSRGEEQRNRGGDLVTEVKRDKIEQKINT